MNQSAIFWPVLAHVLLVAVLYVLLGMRRYASVRLGEAKPAAFKLRTGEPERSVTAANSVANQFEAPVLFYVACLSFFALSAVGTLVLVLAWLFVASRYVHAYVHVTSNRLRYRNYSFRAGLALLGLMWLLFAVRLAGA